MFKVPNNYRVQGRAEIDGNNGAFVLPSPEPNWLLAVIASDSWELSEDRWEHVSVHCFKVGNPHKKRTPNWKEMCFVKDYFWDDEDIVIQFHPRKSEYEYVNIHPFTLHLWRPIGKEIPTPARIHL
jgi:hypothetical protein